MTKDEIARIRTGWPPEGPGTALTTGFGHRLSHDVKG